MIFCEISPLFFFLFSFWANQKGEDQVYTCPDRGHDNVNPERDEDGDLVCEECGTVLPETVSLDKAVRNESINRPTKNEADTLLVPFVVVYCHLS